MYIVNYDEEFLSDWDKIHNLCKTGMQSISFIPYSFWRFFKLLCNQLKRRRPLKNISVNKYKYSLETKEIVNFYFSHNKAIEIISCQSNQTSYPSK